MKNLNDEIYLTWTNVSIPVEGSYGYLLREGDTDIFSGSVYINTTGTTTVSINVTNILANRRYVLKNITVGYRRVNDVNRYYAVLIVNNNSISSNYETVLLMYPYKHFKQDLNNNVIFDYLTQNNKVTPMLQGYNLVEGTNHYGRLLPVYPYSNTNAYKIVLHNEFSNNLTGVYYKILADGNVESNNGEIFGALAPVTESVINISDLYNDDPAEVIENSNLFIARFMSTDLPRNADGSYSISTNTLSINKIRFTISDDDDRSFSVTRDLEEGDNKFVFNGLDNDITIVKAELLSNNQVRYTFQDTNASEFKDYENMHFNLKYYNPHLLSREMRVKFIVSSGDIDNENVNLVMYKSNSAIYADSYVLAKFDLCPKHYYLMWQDRFGSFQSQPFEKADTFSEDYNRTNYVTYKNEQRLANIIVQPKITVNSSWIDEWFYPYYESIMVSPLLLLYDSEEDTTYRVIIEDTSFVEKTFNNQSRKLFNMELTLQLDKKQYIQY